MTVTRRRGLNHPQILPRHPLHHVSRRSASRALASPTAASGLSLRSRPRRGGRPPAADPELRPNGERGRPSPGLPAVTFSPPLAGWAGGRHSRGVPAEPGVGCVPAWLAAGPRRAASARRSARARAAADGEGPAGSVPPSGAGGVGGGAPQPRLLLRSSGCGRSSPPWPLPWRLCRAGGGAQGRCLPCRLPLSRLRSVASDLWLLTTPVWRAACRPPVGLKALGS